MKIIKHENNQKQIYVVNLGCIKVKKRNECSFKWFIYYNQ